MNELLPEGGQLGSEQMETPPSVFHYEGEFSDYLTRLQEALTVSSEQRDIIEGYVDEASSKVCSLLLDERQHGAVVRVASANKWLLTGSPHEKLPSSLIVTAEVNDSDVPAYHVKLDERDHFMEDVNALENKLQKSGLGDAYLYKVGILGQRHNDITEIISDYARSSAAARFIQSFEQPPQGTTHTVLTPFWRQVKQTHIEDGIRKRHRMGANEDFMPGTTARRELGRLLFQLDDETMPRINTAPHSGLERFEAYALSLLHDALQRQSLTLVDLVTDRGVEDGDPYHYVRVRTRDKDGTIGEDIYLDEVIGDLIQIVGLDAGVDVKNPLITTDYTMLYQAFEYVLYPELRPNFHTLEQLFEESCMKSVGNGVRNIIALGSDGTATSWPYRTRQLARYMEPTYQHGPYDEIELARQLAKRRTGNYLRSDAYWEKIFEDDTASISSRESQEKQRQRTFAYVEERIPNNQVPMRLIVQGNNELLETLPGNLSQFDLKLTVVAGQEHEHQHHYIPGYKLVGLGSGIYDRHEYFYKLDTDGDPYAECTVAVEADKFDELLLYYESIGINIAPFRSMVRSNITVQDVVRGIRAVSDYVYAEDVEAEAMTRYFSADWRYDKDSTYFSKLVRNGRLQVQCTGSATFLNHSLSLLFGQDCSRILSGDVIVAGESRVDGLQHVQVIYHNNGLQFILDATPASNDPRARGRSLASGDTSLGSGRNDIEPRKVTPSNHIPVLTREVGLVSKQLIIPKIEIPVKTTDEKVEELVTNLTRTLLVFNDAATDHELFEAMLKLPQSDPMRTTLLTILTSEAGNQPSTTPAQVLSYLEACLGADTTARKRVGIESYSDAMLTQLAAYTKQYLKLRTA